MEFTQRFEANNNSLLSCTHFLRKGDAIAFGISTNFELREPNRLRFIKALKTGQWDQFFFS